jgi:hypothetical protein
MADEARPVWAMRAPNRWISGLAAEPRPRSEAAFRQNHIDDAVLPSLTAEDLKDLGIGSIGHRRKLLDAVALLCAEMTTKAPLPEAPSTPSKPAHDTAERRQVTVMFADLVGSTAKTCIGPIRRRSISYAALPSAEHGCRCSLLLRRAQSFDRLGECAPIIV